MTRSPQVRKRPTHDVALPAGHQQWPTRDRQRHNAPEDDGGRNRTRPAHPILLATEKRTVSGRLPNTDYRTREYLTEREVERLMKVSQFIRIVTFEACSHFTHVTARRIAQPPTGDLCHHSNPRGCPHEIADALMQRISGRPGLAPEARIIEQLDFNHGA